MHECTVVGSVTRWLDNITSFGHLHQGTFSQRHTKLAKVGSKLGSSRFKVQVGSKLAKVGSKLFQILNIPTKITKDFEIFAKVAKCRQIWSHWLQVVFEAQSDALNLCAFASDKLTEKEKTQISPNLMFEL